MSLDWESLKEKGWGMEEVVRENGHIDKIFLAPAVNGTRRKVRQVRDLKGSDKEYANILFPKKRKMELKDKVTQHSERQDNSSCFDGSSSSNKMEGNIDESVQKEKQK